MCDFAKIPDAASAVFALIIQSGANAAPRLRRSQRELNDNFAETH
jgi:hypothetical protein